LETKTNRIKRAVSQFTLYADSTKGNKPDFHNALNPTDAKGFYTEFVAEARKAYKPEKVHGTQYSSFCAFKY